MQDLRALALDVHEHWLKAMRCGDYEAAWRQSDRLELPRREAPTTADAEVHLRWNGTPLRDQHVLVRCLHGLGDSIQFIRYLPEIVAISASVVTLVQPALLPLLKTTKSFGPVADGWGESTPPHTVEVEIMELPYIFRTSAETLPHGVPYFDVKEISKRAQVVWPWNLQAPSKSKRVGIVWASSSWNPSRSIAISALAPLFAFSHLEFYALQQDLRENELDAFPIQIHPLCFLTREIVDVAAAMLQMDLIITVDTLTAHLAGALGCPVWLLLQYAPDWRWQSTGDTSPWYPTMRLFRQPRPEDWESVGEAVAQELSKL